MPSPRWTRFARGVFAVGMLALLPTACDDEASPTTPMPAPAPVPAPSPMPELAPDPIGANEVVDRETLKLFVEAAAEVAAAGIASEADTYAFLDATFRPEGTWHHGEVYVFVHHRD
ncbi:MAG: hypothetical protein F4Y20_01825, partial [Acidobacteria bacterium]|nr:hypothetical protein [Acidobacteriota bacterium]